MMTQETDWVAYCDAWCECWHFRDAWRQIENGIEGETKEIAYKISGLLWAGETQPGLAEKLLQFGNPITDVFARLLGPRGSDGWKLILKRSRRGAPTSKPDEGIYHDFLGEIVEEHGERGAMKRLAKELKMSPAAVRSALRRERHGGVDAYGKPLKSTYYKRRKRSGRK